MLKCAALLTIVLSPARLARSPGFQSGAAATASTILALLSVVGVPPARAEFVPGYAYVADSAIPPCFDGGPPDRIWEVNPQTGESRVFATIPEEYCGGLTGLAFTPDGQHLMASAFIAGKILRIDADGNTSVALGASDGITAPQGRNNLAYDGAGNLWVGDLFPAEVLRFPVAGGPPDVVLNGSDALTTGVSMALDPSGDMWVAQHHSAAPNLYRVSNEDEKETFHLSGLSPRTIAVAGNGDVYIQSGIFGVFRLPNGDPSGIVNVADGLPVGTIALSPDDQFLYVAGPNDFAVVELSSGLTSLSVEVPGSSFGEGMAVYVPEPATAALWSAALLLFMNPSYSRLARRSA